MLTLLIGGARSGKSDLAVEIGQRHAGATAQADTNGVTFIATAQALDGDMHDRIAHHRSSRPRWPTIEAPLDLAGALESAPDSDLVIVDCLTLWVSNAMLDGWSDDRIDLSAATTATCAANRGGPTVVVTNEVGLGVHPETDLGRHYRDVLGRVNRVWAGAAHRSLLLVAGRALRLDDPWAVLT